MKCPLCGYNIDDIEVLSCQECPLMKDCTIKNCPNCGYSLIDTSKVEKLLKKVRKVFDGQ